ncbi:DNA-binding transcriptional LysR family regulator [Maritalea mobilis]|uniref:DNA-binding transcriptional LysR family regulator n=1 Tax=Maritalea mobilis TaxID=483324 RepID=A0A4R6VPW2_9HYPH|nr:LysR family transcriptional regulator [Maritalea mobilis]TDQ66083.1 DNA-binding transcriptional LysR family regulator [Maritalea mobilis]
MNWDDARMFLAVGRHGQFLAASRTLGINQATLSRRISALEADVGSKLLVRRTNGCELTEAGRKMLTALEQAESNIMDGLESVSHQDSDVSGTVRIGAPDGFGIGFFASRLGALDAKHPNLKIELVPVPRSFSLSQREADIAVMVGRPDKGRLVVRKLVDYSLGLYAAKSYLDQAGRPHSRNDLADHKLIGFVDDLIYAPSLDYVQEFYRGWRSSVAVSSATGQVEAAKGGAGIAILHDYLVLPESGLEPVLPDLKISRSYWLAVHESQRNLARIAAVNDFLIEIVGKERNLFA